MSDHENDDARPETRTSASMFDEPHPLNINNRQLNDVHEEILEEMRRANRVAAENQRETNRLLQQTNEIAEQHLTMYRDFFDFMKNKFK